MLPIVICMYFSLEFAIILGLCIKSGVSSFTAWSSCASSKSSSSVSSTSSSSSSSSSEFGNSGGDDEEDAALDFFLGFSRFLTLINSLSSLCVAQFSIWPFTT